MWAKKIQREGEEKRRGNGSKEDWERNRMRGGGRWQWGSLQMPRT